MEPEVHIVDRYMQLVKRCFTMTNIMLEGGKEIDILAFNPLTQEKIMWRSGLPRAKASG